MTEPLGNKQLQTAKLFIIVALLLLSAGMLFGLIGAGVMKAKWQMSALQIPFSSMMMQLRPFFITFFISGTLLMTGFLLIIFTLLRKQKFLN